MSLPIFFNLLSVWDAGFANDWESEEREVTGCCG